MKSLVTGATGFLGSAVMRCLVSARHDVRVLVRPGSNRKNLADFPVEIIEGDLLDHASLHRAVNGCDNLFHVAADYRLWVPDPEVMHGINVTGTEALILAAAEANEETPCDSSAIRGNYKRSKYQAEQIVKQLTVKHQLPLIIVNPSTPIGPGDIRPTPTGRIVLDTLMGRMPAYVNTGLNIAHVDDIAHGHLLALQQGKFGQQYILGGDNLSLLQILQCIDEVSETPRNRINIPTNIMLPLAWCMEKIAAITRSEPRATVDSIHMAKKLMFFSSSKAERELGYHHRPAIEALRDAVKWFKDNGYCQ